MSFSSLKDRIKRLVGSKDHVNTSGTPSTATRDTTTISEMGGGNTQAVPSQKTSKRFVGGSARGNRYRSHIYGHTGGGGGDSGGTYSSSDGCGGGGGGDGGGGGGG